MVRILVEKIIDGDLRYIEAAGTSADEKPTENLVTGSVFVEVDTGTVSFYEEENGDWYPVSGGGNSDGGDPGYAE